jgi:hypothetical protein
MFKSHRYAWLITVLLIIASILVTGCKNSGTAPTPNPTPATSVSTSVTAVSTAPTVTTSTSKPATTTSVNPADLIGWISPAKGAVGLSQTPTFQWASVSSAGGYELVIDSGTAVSLTENTYTLPYTLDYGSTHTWKVRAMSGTTAGSWVSGSFTVIEAPATTSTPTPTPTSTTTTTTTTSTSTTTTTTNGGGGSGGGGGGGSTKPSVKTVSPLSNAKNVAVNTHITAVFSKAMNSSTISETTFTLKEGTAPVLAGVSFDTVTKTATLIPADILANATVYTATITTGVKDTSGESLVSAKIWSFTTANAVDTTPPSIESASPAPDATNVVLNPAIYAVFSEDLDESTVTSTNFTLKKGSTSVGGNVIYDNANKTVTFTPSSNLSADTTYTATFYTGIKDATGNPLANNYVWNFKTGGSGNLTGVTMVSPSSIKAGEEFTVEIQVNNVKNLVSYQFRINYDNTVIELIDSTDYPGGIEDGKVGSVVFTPSWFIDDSESPQGPGKGSIRWASGSDLVKANGQGYLTKLHFKALKAGTSTLVLKDAPAKKVEELTLEAFVNKLFDYSAQNIPFEKTDGEVTVSAP